MRGRRIRNRRDARKLERLISKYGAIRLLQALPCHAYIRAEPIGWAMLPGLAGQAPGHPYGISLNPMSTGVHE